LWEDYEFATHTTKTLEHAEGGGDGNTEVTSNDGVSMIAEKRRPALIETAITLYL
jgi:hypothetical protein